MGTQEVGLGSSQPSVTEGSHQQKTTNSIGFLSSAYPLAGHIAIYDKGYYGIRITQDSDEALRAMYGVARSMRVIVRDVRKGLVYFATLRAKNGHYVYLRLPRSVFQFLPAQREGSTPHNTSR